MLLCYLQFLLRLSTFHISCLSTFFFSNFRLNPHSLPRPPPIFMPPKFALNPTTRPLQSEIATLQKLLSGDILEHSARILEHYTAAQVSNLEPGLVRPPQFLVEKLSEKCNAFETVCDQIYFILEQSKRALQLDWQQKKLNLSDNGNQAKREESETGTGAAAMEEMMGTDLSLSNVDFDMAFDSTTDAAGTGGESMGAADGNELQKEDAMEEDDMEELLQAQRERLDRLRSLLIHRVDAESLTANQGGMGGNDDLLF